MPKEKQRSTLGYLPCRRDCPLGRNCAVSYAREMDVAGGMRICSQGIDAFRQTLVEQGKIEVGRRVIKVKNTFVSFPEGSLAIIINGQEKEGKRGFELTLVARIEKGRVLWPEERARRKI